MSHSSLVGKQAFHALSLTTDSGLFAFVSDLLLFYSEVLNFVSELLIMASELLIMVSELLILASDWLVIESHAFKSGKKASGEKSHDPLVKQKTKICQTAGVEGLVEESIYALSGLM